MHGKSLTNFFFVFCFFETFNFFLKFVPSVNYFTTVTENNSSNGQRRSDGCKIHGRKNSSKLMFTEKLRMIIELSTVMYIFIQKKTFK